nr:RNA-directed DNA polymerase, eukaryota, reverse transcriptase zinc-binding domain protein [Tanacetum cinerariifolium]GEX43349.1 RNA-directed DNA polymerase, eukaryota, reverse transcriptase zinc-binding domain protein [Tanacetum cinerariifolium]
MTWISWKKVLAHKQDGGLGVNIIYALNHALLFKWIWRFRNNPNALWVQVVKAIHAEDGDQPLKFRFPRLFALETNTLISMAERKMQGIGLASFRRHLRGGVESTQWEEMLELLDTVHLSSMADRWAWTLHGMGSFTVSSARVFIDNKYLITGGEPTSWCNLIPIKIDVMAWRPSLDKLPTRLNLDARGIDVPTVLCPICGEHLENVSHLFFSCSFVSPVYVLIA